MNLKSYKSIQYDFPSIYEVGELGAPIGWAKKEKKELILNSLKVFNFF